MFNFKLKIPKLNLNNLLILLGIISVILLIVFWFWWGNKEIDVNNLLSPATKTSQPVSSIAGIPCNNYARRPIAVMMPSDSITRPLSGIGAGDIVFEMPVTPGGVTRLMAVYQCNEPAEIGSIRSAREDFIPLAASLKAIYAHWGGEHEALKKLNSHIIDNVDAMVYENVYFYRKKGIPQPHNGFTNFQKLRKGSEDLKYGLNDKFSGYTHLDQKDSPKNIINLIDSISVNYVRPYNIEWNYDPDSNSYKRLRGDQPEIDKNTNSQVSANVIVVMETTSSFTSKDYLTVITTGEGTATVYQNGIKINGKWSKDPSQLDSKLLFYDNEGEEIKFTPGNIWVEIITN